MIGQTLTALFPDRESADHAIAELQHAGFNPSRLNAEDFERAEYYLHQMPQGATLVSVDPGEQTTKVRAILGRLGGEELADQQTTITGTPTAFQGTQGEKVPTAPSEQHALVEKGQEEASGLSVGERMSGKSPAN